MGLKALLSSGTDNYHEAEIDGHELRFYPVRTAAMLRAESVVTEIARAITGFFDPNAEQYTKRQLLTEQDPETGAVISSSVEDPISPVHAKERIARRQNSVAKAVQSLMGEENAKKLAILVLDSLRDDVQTVDDVLGLDASTFVKLVKETVVANAPQLAPLLSSAVERMTEKVGPSLGVALAEQPDKEKTTTTEKSGRSGETSENCASS